jgi:hypothetical protein
MHTLSMACRAPKRRLADNDPWVEGYEAREHLTARSANPYHGPDTQALWDDGWMEAESEAAGARLNSSLASPECARSLRRSPCDASR